MKRVIIESPYAGDVERNARYLVACMRDSLKRGEAPYASHRMFPGVLDDLVPEERELGISAGLVWGQCAELTAVYIDLHVLPMRVQPDRVSAFLLQPFSSGMLRGIQHAAACGRPMEARSIGGEWSAMPAHSWNGLRLEPFAHETTIELELRWQT